MRKIKYTPLSGPEQEVTGDFILYGMSALWGAREDAPNDQVRELLDEAHRIMSAILYGKIKFITVENI